jgi:hypothetical protein
MPGPWFERSVYVSRFIPAGSSVLDFGAGDQDLRGLLMPKGDQPKIARYIPVDMVKTTPDTRLCDFNAGKWPRITERVDVVVCAGVLEYANDPALVLRHLKGYGDTILLSYLRKPWFHPWPAFLPPDELVRTAEAEGFSVERIGAIRGGIVYRLR